MERHPERILVVLELSGGNDGLNTVVPHGDPAYYRARPHIGIPAQEVLKVDDTFGFHPSMVGFERLYKDGRMAVVHGCGYDHPSLSHFSSMSYWHTGVPNAGEPLGWLGRLADDHLDPASTQSDRQHRHVAVARRPQRESTHRSCSTIRPRFRRDGTDDEKHVLAAVGRVRTPQSCELDARLPLGHGAKRRRQLRLRPPGVRPPTARRSTTASATRSAADCSVSRR